MTKDKEQKPSEELNESKKQAMLEHVFYEFEMFFYTSRIILLDPIIGNNQHSKNSIIESNLLHLRNLKEFFKPESNRNNKDNVNKNHFGYTSSVKFEINAKDLHRYLCHISIKRSEKPLRWDHLSNFEKVGKVFNDFLCFLETQEYFTQKQKQQTIKADYDSIVSELKEKNLSHPLYVHQRCQAMSVTLGNTSENGTYITLRVNNDPKFDGIANL